MCKDENRSCNFAFNKMFKTKKAAKEAGFYTKDEWFRKFRVPLPSARPTVVKSAEYYSKSQTEELYSLTKGQKEIGPLRDGSDAVGVKRLPRRSVRYKVYRESDFIFEPKTPKNIKPAQSIDLIAAILKLQDTAENFERTSKNAKGKSSRRIKRSFQNRAKKLRKLVDVGLKMAINQERVLLNSCRRGWYKYQIGDRTIKSRIMPPNWFDTKVNETKSRLAREQDVSNSKCRLVDAIFTVEEFAEDPTL